MPKAKTRRAVAKRMKVTGSGKLIACGCGMRHHLECKSAHKKRELSADGNMAQCEGKVTWRMLGKKK